MKNKGIIEEIRLSMITCSDKRMDIIDKNRMLDTPINKYEINCEECQFPNIDKIPNPYYIAKGRDFSGIEINIADLGNLFISDRIKKIFELLIPEQCVYKKTFIDQTNIVTKWWLAIPINTIITGEVKDNIERCKKCNQPLHAHPGLQYKFWINDLKTHFDIIKSKNWISVDEKDWRKSWIIREIFLSVRLIFLLKNISAKGIHQYAFSIFKKLTKDEKEWIELSIKKIGDLKNPKKKEVSQEMIENIKHFYSNNKNSEFKIMQFEKKFKISSNEVVKIICCIEGGTKIKNELGFSFIINSIENWEFTKTKLIAFAFDEYGNSLLFNPKDKNCPIYIYDHETMFYNLIYESILDILDHPKCHNST